MLWSAKCRRNYWTLVAFGVGLVLPQLSRAQTTQGLIAGRVFDAATGQPATGAVVTYYRREMGAVVESGMAAIDTGGYFTFSYLPPGTYQLRVCIKTCDSPGSPAPDSYQPQEIDQLELRVAARLEVNFALRKLSDVWKAGIAQGLYQDSSTVIIHYYAADVAQLRSAYVQLAPYRESPLNASISYVIDPDSISNLPLNGRDIYTTLVLEAGVAADTGTSRGLGLSVNGQRPTASSYLLDGLENNNTLITGPLTALAPEMIQEYRISTSSWSAEYGGTVGFVANAVTRQGSERWHGVAYFDLKNDALDANTFLNNSTGVTRLPFKEAQYGFQAGGPLVRHRLFLSTGLEIYRNRTLEAPSTYQVPSPDYVTTLAPSNPAYGLLTRFPTPATTPGNGTCTVVNPLACVSSITLRPPFSLDRKVGLARLDYVSGFQRLMLRAAVNRFDWPDFLWYPYTEFNSGLTEPLNTVALGYTAAIRPDLMQELHAAWSNPAIRWDRAHPEIPTIVVATMPGQPSPLLPGSPAFYSYHDSNHGVEVNDAWTWAKGHHIVRFGAGMLLRQANMLENPGAGGQVTFQYFSDIYDDDPYAYTAALNRLSPQFQPPLTGRTCRVNQFSSFAEDTWRIGRRLVLNAGLRWEYFGAPVNIGAVKDVQVQLGSGTDFEQRLSTASLVQPASGDQKVYSADGKSFAPRFGVAWDPGGRLPVVRAGFGIFYDRPFDNLWDVSSNNIVIPAPILCQTSLNLCAATQANPLGYLAPAATLLSNLSGQPIGGVQTFPPLTLIDPQLKNGYTQSYFLGLQKHLFDSWDFELNTLGALGRRLTTTDVVNRSQAYNVTLPEILWRSSQGSSDYNALTAVARYHSRFGFAQISYTWSHSIDNQSDPLAGDYFDLGFININASATTQPVAAFMEEFNSHGDRASSDFDQRRNLVFYSWWNVPSAAEKGLLGALTRNWRLAQLGAFRSGFPYSVLTTTSNLLDPTGPLLNPRADIVAPIPGCKPATPQPGSVTLLSSCDFAAPANGAAGNTGRNEFRGPGLWNIDLSVSRAFPLHFHDDAARLLLRADFYNAFNHANLNNPINVLGANNFGQASYGRQDYNSGFPALAPLQETPRQVQIIVKVEF